MESHMSLISGKSSVSLLHSLFSGSLIHSSLISLTWVYMGSLMFWLPLINFCWLSIWVVHNRSLVVQSTSSINHLFLIDPKLWNWGCLQCSSEHLETRMIQFLWNRPSFLQELVCLLCSSVSLLVRNRPDILLCHSYWAQSLTMKIRNGRTYCFNISVDESTLMGLFDWIKHLDLIR